MGYRRSISTSFWCDSKIEDTFSPEDKYIYLYLLTNPQTNICGCYEISDKRVVNETGYNIDTIRAIFYRLDTVHKVIKYNPETKEVLLLHWGEYNWSGSEKLQIAVERVAEQIKTPGFAQYVLDSVKKKRKEPKEKKNSNSNTEIEIEIDSKDSISSKEYAYPIDRVSKKPSPSRHKYGEYKNVLLSDEEMEKLAAEFPNDYKERIENLSSYIASSGKSYKSHLAVIRTWARKDGEKKTNGSGTNWLDNYEPEEWTS